jgi:hypothetical protein
MTVPPGHTFSRHNLCLENISGLFCSTKGMLDKLATTGLTAKSRFAVVGATILIDVGGWALGTIHANL